MSKGEKKIGREKVLAVSVSMRLAATETVGRLMPLVVAMEKATSE